MKNKHFTRTLLEKSRGRFFLLGITVVTSLTLVAFTVTSYEHRETSSVIPLPDDEAVMIFQYPDPSFTRKKQAAKQQVVNTADIKIVEKLDDGLKDRLNMDVNKLGNVGTEEDGGDDVSDEDVNIEMDKVLNWGVSRTPYFTDCENNVDRALESECTYRRIRQLVSENTVYPTVPKEMGLESKVLVTFIIDKNGEVTQVEALNVEKVHKEFVSAAINGVNALPKMNPGTDKLQPVNIRLTIPVHFTLH